MSSCSTGGCRVKFPAVDPPQAPQTGLARNPFMRARCVDPVPVEPVTLDVAGESSFDAPMPSEPVRLVTKYPEVAVAAPVASAGVRSPFARVVARAAGLARSAGIGRSGVPIPPGVTVDQATWDSYTDERRASITASVGNSGEQGGRGPLGTLPLPPDMRAQYTNGQWADLDDDARREAIRIAHATPVEQQVFNDLLRVADLSIRTWLTMDERDRAERAETMRREADDRRQRMLDDIARNGGGAPSASQQAMLDALAGMTARLATITTPPAQEPKGVSTTVVVAGVAVVGALVLGAVLLSRPRRNPGLGGIRVPQLRGATVDRPRVLRRMGGR